MKNRQLLTGFALAAALAAAAFWFARRRHTTMLSGGKLYSANPAYDQAGY